jgi:hypothetical protein
VHAAVIHVLVPGANTDTPNKRGGSSVYVCSNIRLTLVGVWVGVGVGGGGRSLPCCNKYILYPLKNEEK